jgi:hypothetical protein
LWRNGRAGQAQNGSKAQQFISAQFIQRFTQARTFKLTLAGLAALAFAGGGYWHARYSETHPSTADAYTDANIVLRFITISFLLVTPFVFMIKGRTARNGSHARAH